MLSDTEFDKILDQFEEWLDEFMDSDQAANLTTYQADNIGRMLKFLLLLGRASPRHPRTWTDEIVLDLAIHQLPKVAPEGAIFYKNFALALAPFYHFAGEKRYVRHGKAIGEALLAQQKKIRQTREDREELKNLVHIAQQVINEGIDVDNPDEISAFLRKKQAESAHLEDFWDKLEAKGIDIGGNLDEDVMKKILKDKTFSEDLDEEKVKETIAFIKTKLAQGIEMEDVLEDFPPTLMPTLFGLMQSGRLEYELMKDGHGGHGQQRRISSRADRLRKKMGRKVGRNEACPCGSGKKFKYCCGKAKNV